MMPPRCSCFWNSTWLWACSCRNVEKSTVTSVSASACCCCWFLLLLLLPLAAALRAALRSDSMWAKSDRGAGSRHTGQDRTKRPWSVSSLGGSFSCRGHRVISQRPLASNNLEYHLVLKSLCHCVHNCCILRMQVVHVAIWALLSTVL